MKNAKKMLTKLAERYVIDTFTAGSITVTSGTPGTYSVQQTIDISKPGYTPIGVINVEQKHLFYKPTLTISSSTLYVLYWRAQTSAYSVPAGDVVITVLYEKA